MVEFCVYTGDFPRMFERLTKCVQFKGVKKFHIRVPSVVCHDEYRLVFCGILALDLMWSDPEDVGTWAVSPRGAGYLFGAKVTTEVSQVL